MFSHLVNFTWPWAPTQRAIFLTQVFLVTRLPSAALEPLIDFLAYLEPESWFINPIFDKNQKVAGKL